MGDISIGVANKLKKKKKLIGSWTKKAPLPEHRFAGVAWHLEQEEARVGLRQEVISRTVLVQNLDSKK